MNYLNQNSLPACFKRWFSIQLLILCFLFSSSIVLPQRDWFKIGLTTAATTCLAAKYGLCRYIYAQEQLKKEAQERLKHDSNFAIELQKKMPQYQIDSANVNIKAAQGDEPVLNLSEVKLQVGWRYWDYYHNYAQFRGELPYWEHSQQKGYRLNLFWRMQFGMSCLFKSKESLMYTHCSSAIYIDNCRNFFNEETARQRFRELNNN